MSDMHMGLTIWLLHRMDDDGY